MELSNRGLARLLYEVRSMLWTNAQRRFFGARTPNIGVCLAQIEPEVLSLRRRVEARAGLPPREEAKATARLLPLPALEYWVVPALAELVREGHITAEGLQSFLLTSEFGHHQQVAEDRPEPVLAAAAA